MHPHLVAFYDLQPENGKWAYFQKYRSVRK